MKALALALLLSAVVATPAASGATSQARAKRLAARALAPQTVTASFCLPQLSPSGRFADKWYCVVWVAPPAGQECHAVVNVRKARAKVVHPVTCGPLPTPVGSDKR
jgi:hypothetical protein